MMISVLFFSLIGIVYTQEENTIKFTFLIEEGQENLGSWFEESLKSITISDESYNFESDILTLDHTPQDSTLLCNSFTKQPTVIIDATWTGNEETKNITTMLNLPYVRIDLSISPVLELLDKYLSLRNSTDVVVIFENAQLIDQALYYWIDSTRLRMIISDKLDKVSATRIKQLIPLPNSYAIVATTSKMIEMMQLAVKEKLLSIPERWNFAFLDFSYDTLPNNLALNQTSLLKLEQNLCCQLLGQSDCTCPDGFLFQKSFLDLFMQEVADVVISLSKNGVSVKKVKCEDDEGDTSNADLVQQFSELLASDAQKMDTFHEFRDSYRLNIKAQVEQVPRKTVAQYDENQELSPTKGNEIAAVKAFYRVGIVYSMPWTYQVKDHKSKKARWTGYCVDFIAKLAETMNFDYELVVPKNGTFGEKDKDGKWDGIIGDIAKGETDFAIGAVVMRADREEVVDYVAPYFEISGISIVMRKPLRKTSLFRFMTVLKLEVWLSIVGALVITAFMIWFIDKYSPYSAQNNRSAYPYECREFSIKECFWFALTSFTPQGGGEAPKSLSARTLVTAYWLFVVLMLATFTANLAAFLTVERMQTPVQNLEQLARQSRINYTVVQGSDTHEYFINMKYAEDTLYRMWKELTLNASTDDIRYRVWDYPIREQYGHILLAINESSPVANASEGFFIVNERTDGDFAFIHDSSEIKYEISRNCNLTEVGEVFAEKPYAVIVQQGSHLRDPIGMKILDLQKDRFFESIRAKYWNNSVRGACSSDEDSEGITLESLGGVFIATLFGLAVAMVTLGFEVLYYKRKENKINQGVVKKQTKNKKNPAKAIKMKYPETITIGSQFKPIEHKSITPNISLYPRRVLNNNLK